MGNGVETKDNYVISDSICIEFESDLKFSILRH